MNKARLAFLIRAYFNKTATAAERDELMNLLNSSESDDAVKSLLTELWEQQSSRSQVFSDSQGDDMLVNILQAGKATKPVTADRFRSKLVWLQRAAAAAVLLFVVAGAYLWLNPNRDTKKAAETSPTAQQTSTSIVPGGNKAVLTLADGTTIQLDSAREGALAKQGNAKVIINLSSAVLTYQGEKAKGLENLYNTLSTPKGGQYRLVLTDGTKVWLNASSSIHFPVAFNGKERNVTITGEAYFEVAKNMAKPFMVTVGDAKVQVLGTHFNIMAYDDENDVRTTLLEGSVRVSKGVQNKILAPGQQLKMMRAGDMRIGKADIEEVMAWKNGWFKFTSNDIQTIMRQVARWYDVEVVYDGKIPEGHFSGIVSRQNSISQVLQIMQSDINFKIEGKKVTVYNVNQ